MNLSDFDYPLPKDLIADKPIFPRDHSKLLVVDRKAQTLSDKKFMDIVDYIQAGDVLVLNNTKVFSARMLGQKKGTGGKVDILLLEPYQRPAIEKEEDFISMAEAEELKTKKIWRALVQPSLKENQEIIFPEQNAQAFFLKRDDDGIPLIEFKGVEDVREFAQKIGTMPLPPYIKREVSKEDIKNYQTVYAEKLGAVAAPTAGLHFTPELLDKIKAKGAQILFVTLHVGYGTFKPVDDLESHKMHHEFFELSAEVAQKINTAKQNNHKVWAVGTTTLRVLETCVQNRILIPGTGQTDLFIKPPFEFEMVDHLITNFHLPKTTLLLLVSAFMGEDLRKKTYAHAIEEKYRFFSYGDAMLIV